MKTIPSLRFLTFVFCLAFLDTAWAQPLTVTTIAGQFKNAGYINGVGTNALFEAPSGISADPAGNLYVIDYDAIRKISPNLTVNTIAGLITFGGYHDASTNALFQNPWDLAVDKNGYIYVADWGNRVVRKISPLGVVTTLAGNGSSGYIDATGTNAEFSNLYGITVDSSGNVYVTDAPFFSSQLCLIRKITPDGVVSTLAGGAQGYNDGVGTSAQFYSPQGLAVDAGGTVYVADGFGIRKVSPDGTVTTWAGSQNNNRTELDGIGANAGFYGARGIALDRSGGAYVTDENGETIRYVSSAGVVSTVAGLANQTPSNHYNDGVGSDARFISPYGIAVDTAGNVFITDEYARTVLKGGPPPLSPIGSFTESPGVTPVRSNNPWQFTAHYTNIVSDLRLRVQSTITTSDEGSWQDLPGNHYMTNNAGAWTLNTTNVPTGTRYFRVVASAPGYFDSASGPVGPETVLGLPQLSAIDFFVLTTGGTPVRSSNPWQFLAYYTNLVSGLQLRVQSTSTTNDAGSWQDLPGNPDMIYNNDGSWTLNITDVPTGSQYFRAVASALGYVDGVSVTVGPQNVLDGIAPFGFPGFPIWGSLIPFQTGNLWVFNIDESSVISGLNLRVQSSGDGGTNWNDLPGGQMTRFGSIWALNTTNVPTGQVSFRVVAFAPNYINRISKVTLTIYIEGPLPVVTKTISAPGRHTLSLDDIPETKAPDPLLLYLQAINEATFNLLFGGNVDQFTAALTVAGQKYLSAAVTIGPGQTMTSPGLNVNSGGVALLQGTYNGPVETAPNGVLAHDPNTAGLIAQDGSSMIGNDGSSLIGNDGSSLIGQDGGGLIGQDGGGLIGQDGSGLIGQDGSGLISEDLSGGVSHNGTAAIVSQGAGNIVSQSAGRRHSPKGPGPTQPTFTGQMTINGNFYQFGGTLMIGIAGTNTLSDGAQQFDQLVVNGTAYLIGGGIAFELFDPSNQTNRADVFQPADGATFDVVVASNIVASAVHIRGPVWGDGLFFSGSVVTRNDGLQAVRLMATHIPPHIFLQSAGSELQLVYGTNYTGYTVQSTPTLSPTNWTTFSTGTNVVVLSPTNASGFFRLSKP